MKNDLKTVENILDKIKEMQFVEEASVRMLCDRAK